MKTIFLSTLLILGVMSCKSKKGTSKTLNSENSSWEVISLSDKTVNSKQTFIINDEKINGNGACNKYSGKIILGENNSLKITDIFGTKMGCENLSEEQLFFENMRNSTSYKLSKNDELSFYNTDKVMLVKLKKIQ